MASDDTGKVVIDLLTDRIDAVAKAAEETAKGLSDHVKECSKMHKLVLLGVIVILLWLVSPKAAELITKVLGLS